MQATFQEIRDHQCLKVRDFSLNNTYPAGPLLRQLPIQSILPFRSHRFATYTRKSPAITAACVAWCCSRQGNKRKKIDKDSVASDSGNVFCDEMKTVIR